MHWVKTNKELTLFIKNYINFLRLSSPSASLPLQHGSFVPRELLAKKGLFTSLNEVLSILSLFCESPPPGEIDKCFQLTHKVASYAEVLDKHKGPLVWNKDWDEDKRVHK